MPFDVKEYLTKANEGEQAARAGKPPEKPAVAAEPAKPVEPAKPAEEDHAARASRSERRQLRQLLRQVGELTGKLQVYETIGKKTDPAPDPDAKPERAAFANDAEYTAALVTWQGKQDTGATQRQQQMREHIEAMAEKCTEDIKLIPDWDEVAKATKDDEQAPLVDPNIHGTFMMLMANSEYQALAMHYFAQHPDELEEILELADKPAKQIEEFRMLEGHLKREYRKLKAAAGEKKSSNEEAKQEVKQAPPVEEKKPKLPRPSDSIAVRGGSTPSNDVSPLMPDGKTLNPAWKEQRNMREGLRR